ncbi:hypothetical protein SAMN05192574_103256 [Mucilaginibacter gossypiicola]|uniref:Uncharacterized protein n=1 Tax=Mucilaginibacter gossypiicola TaxID=551995 RepID=A0A1H8GU98_9SPHI|nr:hypothetical protein SAMN05192574_103256 [Mucilaginibacter gossypiicola]
MPGTICIGLFCTQTIITDNIDSHLLLSSPLSEANQ